MKNYELDSSTELSTYRCSAEDLGFGDDGTNPVLFPPNVKNTEAILRKFADISCINEDVELMGDRDTSESNVLSLTI